MKILLTSHYFSPSIGGIESVSELLADAFVRRGHEVKVVTQTESRDHRLHPYEIIRCPTFRKMREFVRWCDVFFQNNISLQTAIALIGIRRPWFVTHATWITRADGRVGWRDQLKRQLLAFTDGVSISKAIAHDLGLPSDIVSNPYDANVFYEQTGLIRDRELVFVGRLVSDKGVDLLLNAVCKLKAEGIRPKVTLIGDGPERAALEALGREAGIGDQLEWKGIMTGSSLAAELNRHHILVVPSRWNEPFGIVALEGIACGCVVVGSSGGGLPEAMGPCGVGFPNGDANALADALQCVLTDRKLRTELKSNAAAHLQKHTSEAIGDAYLRLFEEVLLRKG